MHPQLRSPAASFNRRADPILSRVRAAQLNYATEPRLHQVRGPFHAIPLCDWWRIRASRRPDLFLARRVSVGAEKPMP